MAKPKKVSVGSITLGDYSSAIADTDKIPPDDLNPILMGLYGEVGGIMTAAKKHVREHEAFPRYRQVAEDEFGDTLWYFTRLCERLGVSLEHVVSKAVGTDDFLKACAATDLLDGPVAQVAVARMPPRLDEALFGLGQSASALLSTTGYDETTDDRLTSFARSYLAALQASEIRFADVARMNVAKARGRFIPTPKEQLPSFDNGFEPEEQIPSEFKIRINQRKSGKSYLQWNNVFIGDPLTDNIADPDGYRFHDVFHLSHAAILHWSPVFRALIKQKRKSRNEVDEAQDGGRAIVVEEGLTAWIFARAKELDFFEGHERVSFDILKTIQEFVAGYEVDQCPLNLWERAVLEGYSVFRKVRSAKGGWVIGDRKARTISYRPLEDTE